MGPGFLRKFNYWYYILGLLVLSGSVSAQPFLNSLAVLFRARPPWPTTFPVNGQQANGQETSVNSNFGINSASQANGAASQQGILVAHPLPNHASNSFQKFIPPTLPKFPIHLQAAPFFQANDQQGKKSAAAQPQPVLHTTKTMLQPVRQNLQSQPVLQNVQPQPVLQNLQPQPVLQNLQPQQVLQNLQPHTAASNILPQTAVQNANAQTLFQNVQNSQASFQQSQQNQLQNGHQQPQHSIQQQQHQPQPYQQQQSQPYQQQHQPAPTNSEPPEIVHTYTYEEVTHHDIPGSFDETLALLNHDSSATSSGGFAYPDPPSAPRFQSMASNSVEASPNYVTASSNNQPQWQHSSGTSKTKNLENHSSVHRLKDSSREKLSSSRRNKFSDKIRQSSREQLSSSNQHSELLSVSANHYAKAGSSKTEQNQKSKAFRPSPQLHTGPSGSASFGGYSSNEIRGDRQEKKVSSFQPTEAKDAPRFESGFQPISYHQYASGFGTTATREEYTNSHKQYYNPWSASHYAPASPATTTTTTTTMKPPTVSQYRQDRKIINGAVSRSVVTTDASIEESRSSESSETFGGMTTTSSSELVEDWIKPQTIKQSNPPQRFPVYKKKTTPVHDGKPLRIRPVKCDRYHRFGFCPVTSHYPLAQVEKIASRCSALLSHLIAPLPKTDVHYDIVVTRNESAKGRASKRNGSRGWSWKSFRGKPLCNTEELKILPAYAKDEDGQWLIILQTQIWKQEAQVSICSLAHGAQSSCRGLLCNKDMRMSLKTKCVQRFTAQRLAVLDPDNQDRCPVVKSVFLPSACVCLSDEGSSAESPSSAQSSSREHREASSSNQVQVILPHTQESLKNGTFMIVTKKFTTNESSTESQVDSPA